MSHKSNVHRNISNVFERLGYDSTLGQEMFTALAAAAHERRSASSSFSPSLTSGMPHQPLFEESEDVAREQMEKEEEKRMNIGEELQNSTSSSSHSSPSQGFQGTPLSNATMDLEDFVIAAEIDDVFIQIILLKNRLNVSNLFLPHENEEKKDKGAILEKEMTLAVGSAGGTR